MTLCSTRAKGENTISEFCILCCLRACGACLGWGVLFRSETHVPTRFGCGDLAAAPLLDAVSARPAPSRPPFDTPSHHGKCNDNSSAAPAYPRRNTARGRYTIHDTPAQLGLAAANETRERCARARAQTPFVNRDFDRGRCLVVPSQPRGPRLQCISGSFMSI